MTPELSTAAPHHEVDEFRAALARWEVGAPFPVLADRPAAVPGARSMWTEGTARDGYVISSGDGVVAMLAGAFAGGTGRPHRHVQPADLRTAIERHGADPVAVVGVATDLARCGDWPGRYGPRVGLVTARGLAALSRFVYRSLTVPPALDRDVVLTHPAFADAATTGLLSPEELAEETRPLALLEIDAFGRECCAHFPDGVICGRPSLGIASPAGPYLRQPSCLNGRGCFRDYLEEGVRVPADTLAAEVVFLRSCHAMALGNNALPLDVGLVLGLVEGSATAVFGPVGLHQPPPGSGQLLRRWLRAGSPLGEVLHQLNEHGAQTAGPTRLGLIGDPGLIPQVPAAAVTGPGAPPCPPSASALAASPRIGPMLELVRRTRDWAWWGVPVDEAALTRAEHHLLRSALAAGPAGEPAGIAADLGRVAEAAAAAMADTLRNGRWKLGEDHLPLLTELARTSTRCPRCTGPAAVRYQLAHRFHADQSLHWLICDRCGAVAARTAGRTPPSEPAADLVLRVAARDGWLDLELELTNSGDYPARGAVLFAFQDSAREQLPEPVLAAVTLPAGEGRHYPARFDLQGRALDDETATVLILIDGEIRIQYLTVAHHLATGPIAYADADLFTPVLSRPFEQGDRR